jgi:hypothetical protein
LAQQVLGNDPDGATGALLPGRGRRGIDDDLPDHSPAVMMRIAARDEESGERLGELVRVRLGSVTVEMP